MPQSVTSLVALVRDGTDEQKANAARALAMLAFGNDANRVSIVDAGGIAQLVELVRDGTAEVDRGRLARLLRRARPHRGVALAPLPDHREGVRLPSLPAVLLREPAQRGNTTYIIN